LKISITGSNGFLGSRLSNFLQSKGLEVLKVQRKKGLDIINIKDCSKNTDWTKALIGVDTVIHCASVVHQNKKKSFEYYYEVNVQGTESLLKQAAKIGVKNFIFISTIKVNGEFSSQQNPFTKLSSPNPKDFYAISKLLAENSIKEIARESGINFVIIRPTLIYGPGVKANFFKFIKLVDSGIPLPFKNVKNKRSMLFIDNICEFIFNIICKNKYLNKTYLLADRDPISISCLINILSENLQKTNRSFKVSLRLLNLLFNLFGMKNLAQRLIGSLVVDADYAYKEIQFFNPISTEEGINETIQWYLKEKKKFYKS
tara:strand:+ start:6236 stop:7180 length:945 start_codon:yes stop_codon:yes gene_type:complete